MIIICPNCLADETAMFDAAGGNFCTECGAMLDHGGGGPELTQADLDRLGIKPWTISPGTLAEIERIEASIYRPL